MREKNVKSIGILGGSFDPPHKGHLYISRIGIKNLKINKLFWLLTKKNPFKGKPLFSINERIRRCKKIIRNNKKIKIIYLDDKLKSSKVIKAVLYLKKKYKQKIYFIMGSDNLISFHRWTKFRAITKNSTLVVFSRKGFDKKARKSNIFRYLNKKNIIFIKNKTMNVSSSQLRKNYNIVNAY